MFDEQGDRMTDMMTCLNGRINSLEDMLVMSATRTQQRMRDLENSLRMDIAKQNDKQENRFGSELLCLERKIDNMQKMPPEGRAKIDLTDVEENISRLELAERKALSTDMTENRNHNERYPATASSWAQRMWCKGSGRRTRSGRR